MRNALVPTKGSKQKPTNHLKTLTMESTTNSSSRPGHRARFTWGVDGLVLWLRDEGVECRSLTNDIENCLLEIADRLPAGAYLNNYHILYRDSEGTWDGLALTKLTGVEPEAKLLEEYNRRGRQYCVQGIQIRFVPIQLASYEAAVSQILTDSSYRHTVSGSDKIQQATPMRQPPLQPHELVTTDEDYQQILPMQLTRAEAKTLYALVQGRVLEDIHRRGQPRQMYEALQAKLQYYITDPS